MLSVIIPAHNASRYLDRILLACAGFDKNVSEVIVVDDASSDDTAAIARRYGVRLVSLADNKGPGYARNAGAKIAKGDILLFSDADIALPPDAVGIVNEFFARYAEADAFSGVYSIDRSERNILTKYRNLKERHEELSRPMISSACRSSILAMKKKVFDSVGGFSGKWMDHHCEDTVFCGILAQNNINIFINQEFEALHMKKYSIMSLLRQAFERTGAALAVIRKTRFKAMGQYYKKSFYLNPALELVSPAFTVLSVIAFACCKMWLFLWFGVLSLAVFWYTQKEYFVYAARIFGILFMAESYIIRFFELMASEVSIACSLFMPKRYGEEERQC